MLGTNDIIRELGGGGSDGRSIGDSVYHDILLVHRAVSEMGSMSVAVGIPYSLLARDNRIAGGARDRVNGRLSGYCGDGCVGYVDPTPTFVGGDLVKDGIHFTQRGYRNIGERVTEFISNYFM